MEAHVESFGIEPMCRVLRIAPSTWHEHACRKADPNLRSARAKEDELLRRDDVCAEYDALAEEFSLAQALLSWTETKRWRCRADLNGFIILSRRGVGRFM
jgi:putative transposase